ncbi:hypothetical protein K491DRAFT_603498 [Lophiostoma macrostomum CBS 122681]|uniref:N-acetyltransferase domain-containing protein n=1 Tax=Lophiostoma macrostomum CBS 122681 TaxID=1314788 RepID=A0A6A6T010_9PLEO|nr:hypothetical protein K491DRAFT_603498 [Lophiostoma macrostomum CBS 122681]
MEKPKISIAPVSDSEIPTCFRILDKSFANNAPFVDIYFPEHDTASGQVAGSRRLLKWKRGSAESVFVKAVMERDKGKEMDDDRIVGFAVWTHMTSPPSDVLEDVEKAEEVWPDEEDREFMRGLWREYVRPRSRAIRLMASHDVVLELLAVHPEYQRLGAGKGLVTWGTEKADVLGLKAVVEGTPVGRPLYERCGFEAKIEEMSFDVDERFQKRRKPELVFMTREPLMLWGPLMIN